MTASGNDHDKTHQTFPSEVVGSAGALTGQERNYCVSGSPVQHDERGEEVDLSKPWRRAGHGAFCADETLGVLAGQIPDPMLGAPAVSSGLRPEDRGVLPVVTGSDFGHDWLDAAGLGTDGSERVPSDGALSPKHTDVGLLAQDF